jgi:transcriptional regulator with XRE-family HTH domain
MNFGRILRDARKSRRVTLVQLAEKVGVHFSHLSNIERGEAGTSRPSLVAKICAVLAIDPKPLYEEIAIEREQVVLELETDVQKRVAVAIMRAYAAGDDVLAKLEDAIVPLLNEKLD